MATESIFGISGNFPALIVSVAGIIIAIVMYGIIGWFRRKAEKTVSKLDDLILAVFGTPAVVAVLVITLFLSLQVADLPVEFQWILDSKYINVVWILLGAWILSTFVYRIIETYGHRLAAGTESDIDDRMIALAQITSKYVIWFAALLLILYVLEINITPFLAGAGIAGLAIALAAQDFLSNFFGGAIIAVDKPFKLNDRIMIDQFFGDVIHVGARSTRMRTLDNQIVTFPNKKIMDSYVINYAQPDLRMKVRINIGVAYGSDIEKVRQILCEIAKDASKACSYIVEEPLPIVYFKEFGESSLNFQLVVWTNDFSMTLETQDAINTRIAHRFAEEGIEIPFRQLDVHIRK
ncbi:MAG: mechanosensitive ion channel [Methanolinea sp.]|jgi:small-conductance mechanosensitive channel|nr:mechanosensitive ion channel [Methanolinea sp.]